MIFYGTRAKNIKNGQLPNVKCPNCETTTSMTYSVFGKYTHIYWIPFFPYGKVKVTECNNCKKTYEYKELPAEIQTKFDRENEKNPAKNPVWFFSGLFIIAGLIGMGMYFSNQNETENKDFFNNPAKGDVYHTTATNGYYTSMKIDSIGKDSIYFFVNEYETNKKSDVKNIDIDKNYKSVYGFSKEDINQMFETEEIYDIERK
jgi:hypothetical protein